MPPRGPPVTTEGLPIRQRSRKRDRVTFFLTALLQLIAVAIIARQLKALGLLPKWVNTDLVSFAKFLPRNPILVPPCGHLPTRNLLLISENIVFPDGIAPGAVHIKRTSIKKVLRLSEAGQLGIAQFGSSVESIGGLVIDYGSLVISPGIVDVHVHLNEPGRMSWEGITRGTLAAAAGGVTSVVDMPLNCDPTITTPAAFRRKIWRGQEKARVDMAFWAGLVPDNSHDRKALDKLLAMGAVGFKAFMCPSGIDDFEAVDRKDIEAALPVLMRHRKPLMLHAEVVSEVDGACDASCAVTSHATWASSRPPAFEVAAARDIVAALRAVRASHSTLWGNATAAGSAFRVHVAHLGAAEALPIYLEAQTEGLPISIETCPHYLTFADKDVPDGATQFKCAPPLRSPANRDALVEAVGKDQITVISSDHSPALPALKELESGDFTKAWGGIAGLQYTLPAVNTIARDRMWSFEKLASLLSEEPAKLAGLGDRKGRIAVGMDADLVVWDPYAAANTTVEGCFHRHKVSPWRDVPLLGRVHTTFVQGAAVFSAEKGLFESRVCGSAMLLKSKAK